jgi:hypothetical protein
MLLNLQLRDFVHNTDVTETRKRQENLEDQHAKECQYCAHSVQNKKFPVSNEMQSLKDTFESDMN